MTQVLDSPSEQAEAEARAALENEAAGFHDEVAAAREEEGLDAESALPSAADDDGESRDISDGIKLGGVEAGQLSFAGVGGKKPTGAKLRVVGGAFDVPANLEKGSIVHLELAVRIGGVSFDDTIDPKTTQATDCTRNHKGRVIGATVIDQGLIEKHDELRECVEGFLSGGVSRELLAAAVGVDVG
jgi:hypothetical protein